MPVEIRHADHRRFARSHQGHQEHGAHLPLARFETPHERRRRKGRAALHLLFIFAFALLICTVFFAGKASA